MTQLLVRLATPEEALEKILEMEKRAAVIEEELVLETPEADQTMWH